jgi:hypothetical protein
VAVLLLWQAGGRADPVAMLQHYRLEAYLPVLRPVVREMARQYLDSTSA